MLIFLRAKLAFLANPKTGTTAVEMALKPQAEVIFSKSRKHVTAVRYARKVAPFLEDTFGVRPEALAVMRNPVDHIGSWYRYRNADRLAGSELSTQGLSFEAYLCEVIADAPPKRAQIGSQYNFLCAGDGTVMAEHVFAYENQPAFRTFLEQRLDQEITIKPKNVSPPADTVLSSDVLAQVRAARADEFALYDRLIAAQGYLHTLQG